MEDIMIFVKYKGRKFEIKVDRTDSIKKIMEKFYIKINREEVERFYTKDKVILIYGDVLLNHDEQSLNKTVNDLELDDDDVLVLNPTEHLLCGKDNN